MEILRLGDVTDVTCSVTQGYLISIVLAVDRLPFLLQVWLWFIIT